MSVWPEGEIEERHTGVQGVRPVPNMFKGENKDSETYLKVEKRQCTVAGHCLPDEECGSDDPHAG